MVSRKKEELDYGIFSIGNEYTRQEIADHGGVDSLNSSREWGGIVEFKNCIVLFSTLIKDDLPPEHAYADVFTDTEFLWESQNRNTQNTPVILRIISLEIPVLLFCRLTSKKKGKATPFTYVGKIAALDYANEKPVEFRFSVEEHQTEAPENLRQLYEWRPRKTRKIRAVEEPDRQSKIAGGQGRQTNPEKRKAVEKRAMEVAIDHYQHCGFTVSDTSATNPYDLECKKDGETLRVEVKGLSGGLGSVDVTINEVLSARSNEVSTDLFVVHSIILTEHDKMLFVGEGGTTYVESAWNPTESKLEATRFRYLLSIE